MPPKKTRRKRDFKGDRFWFSADEIKDIVSAYYGINDREAIKQKVAELLAENADPDFADIVVDQFRTIKYGGAANVRSHPSPPDSATTQLNPSSPSDDSVNGSTHFSEPITETPDEFGAINEDDLALFEV